ncbi:hypothetical protein ACHAPT_010865 [Fusarium lateritium]
MASKLSGKIYKTFEKSFFDKNEPLFSPDGSLDHLLTKTSVGRVFGAGKEPWLPETERLVGYILTKAKKLFAIALHTSLVRSPDQLRKVMETFQTESVTDDDIPLQESWWNESGLLYPENEESDDDLSGSEIAAPLYRADVAIFCEKQWTFKAPVFSTAKFNHDLESQSILPFTKKGPEPDAGSFGCVTQYKIHPDHMVDRDTPEAKRPSYVAVKQIKIETTEDRQKVVRDWEKEAKVLSQMNLLKHEHIVRFITAFRRGNPGQEDHYLMLEWANGGNLKNLWKAMPRPELTPESLKAAFRQLWGLAGAIHKAHEPGQGTSFPMFRHGDLKPENILWFNDQGDSVFGMLKIGDWGLAKGHKETTELRTNRTTTEYGTRRYEPPEEATGEGIGLRVPEKPGQIHKRRSRLYDIWSMGCIMLEFLIWLMYGVEELARFNKSLGTDKSNNTSPFYQLEMDRGKRVATVHRVAAQWMKHMAGDPAGINQDHQTALGDLLEIIRGRLLVVQMPKGLSTPTRLSETQLPSPQKFEDNISPTTPTPLPSSQDDDIPKIKISSPLQAGTPFQQAEEPDPSLKVTIPRGSERALSEEFEDRIYRIYVEELKGNEYYWSIDGSNLRRGPTDEDSRNDLQDNPQYQIESARPSKTERVSTWLSCMSTEAETH